jgi:hypothetical protein
MTQAPQKLSILEKIGRALITIANKRKRKKQVSQVSEVQKKTINTLRELYGFVQYLDTKVLVNRAQRKAFWAKVRCGEPLVNEHMNKIIAHFEKQELAEKKK